MKAKDLRQKNVAELGEYLLELRREQFKLRMQRGGGQLAKPHEITVARKEVARVKTLITEKSKGG